MQGLATLTLSKRVSPYSKSLHTAVLGLWLAASNEMIVGMKLEGYQASSLFLVESIALLKTTGTHSSEDYHSAQQRKNAMQSHLKVLLLDRHGLSDKALGCSMES